MLDSNRPPVTTPRLLTRNDLVRMEGRDAARGGAPPHDNPYRRGSADGVAWRQGYDETAVS